MYLRKFLKKGLTMTIVGALFCLNSDIMVKASNDNFLPLSECGDYIEIDKENFDNQVVLYSIPKEVEEYISDVLEENNEAEIIVYSPDNIVETYASSGSWGSTRQYKGYTLKDWNVHVTNAFDMTNIRTGSAAGSFAESFIVYGAGVALDTVIPFGSAGITLVQFIHGSGTSVYAGSGDKANVAPKYTSDTKFTYVNIGGEYLLGARTHKATLESISWYLYSSSNHTTSSKEYTYNKTYKTPNFDNPDSIAVSGVGIGGNLEEYISFTIGSYTFVLN